MAFIIFYILIFFFALYLGIGFYRCKQAIDAHFDVREDLINQVGALNQRDINNNHFNWAIRHIMYDYVPYASLVDFKSLMTWWNYKTTKEANLALWSDLRFIDPDYNCDQLAEIIEKENQEKGGEDVVSDSTAISSEKETKS